MQQKNYDSEFCGKVPLHQTNMIQPHGVLMIVQKKDLQILQVSENITGILHQPAQEVVHHFLPEYISQDQTAQIRNRFAASHPGKLPFVLSFGPKAAPYPAMIQEEGDLLLVEIEVISETPLVHNFMDVYQELKFVISAMESANTLEAASNTIIRELKRISGFDRIMIYQFDSEWNGTVIAETLEPGMEPYLGLKFPASDIPRQARELYRKSPYRLIPNVSYEPVKLYPVLNPTTNGFTNLSNANLRSVAAVHLEYLGNMQVVASMSTRILMNGNLWGLISCHHRSPKYLSYTMCALFELLSDLMSARVSAVENQKAFVFKSGMHQLLSSLVEKIYKSGGLVPGIVRHSKQLMELLKADGIALLLGKEVHRFGTTPSQEELEELVDWLRNHDINGLYHHAALSSLLEGAEQYVAIASGLLVLPIRPEQGHYLLAFRPEALRKVSWGGNPNEAVRFEPDQKRYHPRSSFRQWQETVKGNAIPWEAQELEIAENFRNFVVEYTLNPSK